MLGHRIISLFLIMAIAQTITASIGRFLPFSGFYPIPRKTPEPINVVTKQTYPIFFPNQLTFAGNRGQEQAYIRNTGSLVQVFMINSTVTDTVTGGPLYGNVYRFRRTEFHWANGTDKAAYTTVNGKNGPALEVVLIYVNLKYGPFSTAIKYRDGVAKIIFQIQIGPKPNPEFENFAAALKRIRNPGPSVPVKLFDTFQWFYTFAKNIGYFAYPGALTDESTGKTYYCTTTILVNPSSTQYISEQQFASTFLKLNKSDGTPLITRQKQKPRGLRPVARSKGIGKLSSDEVVYYASS